MSKKAKYTALTQNPLIADHQMDTVQRVRCMLEYLGQHNMFEDFNNDSNSRYGRFLVHETMTLALKHAVEVQS
jgi:hypothetical protein